MAEPALHTIELFSNYDGSVGMLDIRRGVGMPVMRCLRASLLDETGIEPKIFESTRVSRITFDEGLTDELLLFASVHVGRMLLSEHGIMPVINNPGIVTPTLRGLDECSW